MKIKDKIKFDSFIFNPADGTLYLDNKRVELQPKPTEILAFLLNSSNKLVSRQAIASEVWPDQIVDFDQNINFCIKQIRQVLNDDPKSPQFIETIPKKGYRFIATVELINAQATAKEDEKIIPSEHPADTKLVTTKPIWQRASVLMTTSILLLVTITSLFWLQMRQSENPIALDEKPISLQFNNSELAQRLKRAFYLYEQGGKENFERSQHLFEKILKDSPNVGEAYAGLALLKLYSNPQSHSRELITQQIHKALTLSPESSRVHLAKAKISLYWHWDIQQARKHFEQAVKFDPHSIPALHDLAVVATIQGDMAAAEQSIQQALTIDPGRFQEHYHAGWFYQVGKRYDLALKQCVQSLEISPTHAFSLLCAGRSAAKLNLTQTAAHYLREYMQLVEANAKDIQSIIQSVEQGEIKPFNQWYIDWLKENYQDPFSLSLAYAEIGQIESALASLQIAVSDRHVMVPTAWAFDELSDLRDDPRFNQMMLKVKRF